MKRWLAPGMVAIVVGWVAASISGTGDWGDESWPKVHALASGNVSGFLHTGSMMGPFGAIVQAPFAAIASGSGLVAYRWATVPCLLALGLVGLHLARVAGRRGASSLTQVLVAGLFLVNPLTFAAVAKGHPEELLTAALAVAAVATASEGHRYRTALLLGLAVASKQWAVIAILPVLMALPAPRFRAAVCAAAVAAILILPGLVVSPETFFKDQGNAASTGLLVTPWSVWYPTADSTVHRFEVGSTTVSGEVVEAPPLVGSLSHWLIVLLAVGLPIGLALRRGGLHLSGEDAFALLALLALMRCALDPWDNAYYHVPLLLALIGWDALSSDRLPIRGLAGAGIALLFWHWSHNLSDIAVFNLAYIAVAVSVGVMIVGSLLRRAPAATGADCGEVSDLAPA
jgi:hypothetical protein